MCRSRFDLGKLLPWWGQVGAERVQLCHCSCGTSTWGLGRAVLGAHSPSFAASLYDPCDGCITLDGKPLHVHDPSWLRANMTVVSQVLSRFHHCRLDVVVESSVCDSFRCPPCLRRAFLRTSSTGILTLRVQKWRRLPRLPTRMSSFPPSQKGRRVVWCARMLVL